MVQCSQKERRESNELKDKILFPHTTGTIQDISSWFCTSDQDFKTTAQMDVEAHKTSSVVGETADMDDRGIEIVKRKGRSGSGYSGTDSGFTAEFRWVLQYPAELDSAREQIEFIWMECQCEQAMAESSKFSVECDRVDFPATEEGDEIKQDRVGSREIERQVQKLGEKKPDHRRGAPADEAEGVCVSAAGSSEEDPTTKQFQTQLTCCEKARETGSERSWQDGFSAWRVSR